MDSQLGVQQLVLPVELANDGLQLVDLPDEKCRQSR